MTLARVVANARVAAESRMSDACTITRVLEDATGAYEADTDTFTPDPATTVYSGPCRVRIREAAGATGQVAATQFIKAQLSVSLPAGTTGIADQDIVTIDSAAFSPDLVGVRLRVLAVQRASQATALRLAVEELTT